MKSVTTVVLLGFVAATIVYLAVGAGGDVPSTPREAETANVPPSAVGPETPKEDKLTSATQPVEGAPTAAVTGPVAETTADTITGAQSNPKVIAYYFHRKQRCHTCLTMEAYAEQALKDGLTDAMESGSLEWRAVNVEEAENEHFVKEYELYGSELVMLVTKDGLVQRSKKLMQIWDLVGDEAAFKTFVHNEARAYLTDAP